ncbi:MAG: PAS domain S-box protein [Nitriliruptor sp.]|nr:MAG: PAS domain S-box protein [Nitriliruptor sp.]
MEDRAEPRSHAAIERDDVTGEGAAEATGEGSAGATVDGVPSAPPGVASQEVGSLRTELRQAAQRFGLAWEHSPIGMAMADLDGNWLDANPALCELLGRDREELRGRMVELVTHPDDLGASIDVMHRMMVSGGRRYQLGKRYVRPDGSIVHTHLTASLVLDEDGEPSYLLGQIVDVTKIQAAERRLRSMVNDLERSNQVLESFAELASHELTSPLGTARGLVETALVHHRDEMSDAVADLLERAARQAARALGSSEALLQLASSATPALVREELELGLLLAEVIDAFAEDLARVGGRIEVEAGPMLFGDRVQLQLVFQNLLSNAIKYRRAELPLAVRIHGDVEDDGSTRVHVDDNGRGLDTSDADELFAFGVRGVAGEEVGGLGLGLATCRRIVEHHGGSISAAANEAGGTRVTLTLPPR